MEWYVIALAVVVCVSALALICVVMLQDSNEDGLSGAIAGNRDSYMTRNGKGGKGGKGSLLKLLTKISAAVFIIGALGLYLVQ